MQEEQDGPEGLEAWTGRDVYTGQQAWRLAAGLPANPFQEWTELLPRDRGELERLRASAVEWDALKDCAQREFHRLDEVAAEALKAMPGEAREKALSLRQTMYHANQRYIGAVGVAARALQSDPARHQAAHARACLDVIRKDGAFLKDIGTDYAITRAVEESGRALADLAGSYAHWDAGNPKFRAEAVEQRRIIEHNGSFLRASFRRQELARWFAAKGEKSEFSFGEIDPTEAPKGGAAARGNTLAISTMLQIIGGMAMAWKGMNIHGRLKGISELRDELSRQGVQVDEGTLRKRLKEAAELIPPPSNWPSKTGNLKVGGKT